jgi:O-antigen/teichoic acid export membrane protein
MVIFMVRHFRLPHSNSDLIGKNNSDMQSTEILKSTSPSVDAPKTRTVLHPVLRDIALSGVTAVAVACAGVFSVSLIGRWMGPLLLAQFLLLRRVLNWLSALVLMGLSTALPRYAAYSSKTRGIAEWYLASALICVGTVAVVVVIVLNGGADFFSRVFFGAPYRHLILPLSAILLAHCIHGLVFGYYRGLMLMKRANALQFINFAIVPCVSILLFWRTGSIATIIIATATMTATVALAMVIPLIPVYFERPVLNPVSGAKQLLRYGTARVPGDAALGGLLALGPMIAARYVSMQDVGYMLLGLSLLTVIGTSCNPMNQVLLSKVCMMLSAGRKDAARTYVGYLLSAVLEISVFTCLQMVVFADVVVHLWVGKNYGGHTALLRICLLPIPFYLFYTSMRSVIDAGSERAYNAINIISALLTFVAITAVAIKLVPVAWLLHAIAFALLASLALLAKLTANTVSMLYGLRPPWVNSAVPIVWSFVCGALGYVFRSATDFHTSKSEFFCFEFVIVVMFLALLHRRRSAWLLFVLSAVVQRRPSNLTAKAETPDPASTLQEQGSLARRA